jgi:hypothetical protein
MDISKKIIIFALEISTKLIINQHHETQKDYGSGYYCVITVGDSIGTEFKNHSF